MNIVILHGLYMNASVMKPLSERLTAMGHTTHLINYSTTHIKPEALFKEIDDALAESGNALVGHSLGGLMIQRYLKDRQLSVEQVSHVVTLGSPMQGASIVKGIEKIGMGSILGNSVDFGLEPKDNVWDLPQSLGCIAGKIQVGFLPLFYGFKDASDGTVTIDETRIEGMKDHVATSNTHLSLLYSDEVITHIEHFLHHDSFATP